MLQKPKISVIMTCYNHEKYIREAIGSILDQTLTEFELIIVDDGSFDKTKERINEFQDERLIRIFQENSGPSTAINNGIDRSTGEYIALMSGDDVALPHRFETQLAQIEESYSDIVFSTPIIIGPNSEFLPDEACIWFFGKEFEDSSELLRALFYEENFLCAPTFFGRKSAIKDIGDFKRGLIQLQDYDYWIRACKQNKNIKLYQDRLLKYRYLFGLNLSSKINLDRIEIEKNIIFREFFKNLSVDQFFKIFDDDIQNESNRNINDFHFQKSFLYLKHSDWVIKKIGLESLITQFNDDTFFGDLENEWNIHFSELIRLYKRTSKTNKSAFRDLKETIIRYFSKILVLSAGQGPKQIQPLIEHEIIRNFKEGNYFQAIKLEISSQKFPLHIKLIIFLRKLYLSLKKLIKPRANKS